jgi:hypothetical protein
MKETKYDWSIAPDWAQWAATDRDGDMYWYGNKPNIGIRCWLNVDPGGCIFFDSIPECKDWKDSLEARPQ